MIISQQYMLLVQLIELGLIISTTTTITAAITLNTNIVGRSPNNNRRHAPTLSECAAKGGECDERRGRPVCGTDDRTYPSRCHLMRAQCSGHQVSLKYKGPCRACKEAREYAIKHRAKSPNKFIPRCKSDGTYAAIQCRGDSECWCSDITGNLIERTAVRFGKPRCHEYTRTNIRRSPARRMQVQKLCTPEDRAIFNRNLIGVFQSEYMRYDKSQNLNAQYKNNSYLLFTNIYKQILDWKFSQLDLNHNDTLDKNEFREVKKLVKRVIRPRRCGRVFGKFCDIDGDERLSRKEWDSCIFKNESEMRTEVATIVQKVLMSRKEDNMSIKNKTLSHIYHAVFPQNRPINKNQFNINVVNTNFDNIDSNPTEEEDVEFDNDSNEDEVHDSNKKIVLRPIPESATIEIDNESDCFSDRSAALEEQRNSGTLIYLPDCAPDGRYQRIQCYASTPYCWCVTEETGKHIPGTSVKHKKPQCDSISTNIMQREMKNCPESMRLEFLKELKEFFRKSLIYKPTGSSILSNSTKWNSEDEQISTLSFLILDKNKNKYWERREWKIFRELISNLKTLRKCGRKLPRYCDVNNDKKVSLTEWKNCIRIAETNSADILQSSTQSGSITNKTTKLSGFNPLDQYLKD